jgi:hypothetical protein
MKRVPRRRTWTKLHLSFYLTPSHHRVGSDFFALVPLAFCLAAWDGESEHAEVRNEDGKPLSLRDLADWVEMSMARAQKALAVAVERGTLALGEDDVIVIPKFRRWQLDERTLRRQKQRERDAAAEREAAEDPPPPDEVPHGTEAPAPSPNPWRRDLEELRRRHAEFLQTLPESPRRFRVVWLVGTPRELTEGLARETTWVAEVLFRGGLEPARRVIQQVFEFAWRRAYEGELDEKHLAKSLWGQAFRGRLREWADAQRESFGEKGRAECMLTWEQLAALSERAAERLRSA